mgnify:CR=1 FL=1
MLNFMGRGPTWMGGADLPTAMEDEWVETVASVAYYARNNRHIQFGLLRQTMRSDWDGIEGIRMDACAACAASCASSRPSSTPSASATCDLPGPDTAIHRQRRQRLHAGI